MPPRPPRKNRPGRKPSPHGPPTPGSKRRGPPRRRPKPARFGSRRIKPPSGPPPEGERLQKVLAAAGLGSRRQCEELITSGRVEIDRQTVTELGTRVDAANQEVRVDGVALARQKPLYFAVHKPPGVVSTNRDPSGRPRVIDLVPARDARLFAIGRLDLHSEGLILVTNDGELANRLTHPRYGVRKTYRVMVVGQPTEETLARIRRGVHLAEGLARAEEIRVHSRGKHGAILEMVLTEGQNREIRRLLARVGHKVLRLVRMAVGPVRLGSLPSGAARALTRDEIAALRKAAGE
jgi:23S rRNA pseudouridine2605 synthase